MYEARVDPIRYAWERCNDGVSFPGVLAKGLGPAPSGASSSRSLIVAQAPSGITPIQAALHSLIVSPRRGSPP